MRSIEQQLTTLAGEELDTKGSQPDSVAAAKAKVKKGTKDSQGSAGGDEKSKKQVRGGNLATKGESASQQPKAAELGRFHHADQTEVSTIVVAEGGVISSLHIDRDNKYLFVVYKHHVKVFLLLDDGDVVKLVKEFGPFDSEHIFIDEFCTYMIVMSPNRKQLNYHIFEWEYLCPKLPKAPLATAGPSSRNDRKTGLSAVLSANAQ